ncbi:MAG: methanogenesis marker 9 domain-containing protein [Methanotrichaceae archaeon]|nr:methanogenesis marker 9 domain-containing protein [Methanotrichaceae archaeon]
MLKIGYLDLDNPIAIVTPYQNPNPEEAAGLVLFDGIDLDRISIDDLESFLDELHLSAALGISVYSSEDRPILDAARLASKRLYLLELDFSRSFEKGRPLDLIPKIKKCGTTLSLRIHPEDLTNDLINATKREGLDLIHLDLQRQNGTGSKLVKKIVDLRGPKIMALETVDKFEDANILLAMGADIVSLHSPDPEFANWLAGAVKDYDRITGWYNAPKHICSGGDIRGLAFCCPPIKRCPVFNALKKVGMTPDDFVQRKVMLAKGTPLEHGEGTCFGNLVWCCKITKPCYLREVAMERIKLSGKEYMELKRKLAEELLKYES